MNNFSRDLNNLIKSFPKHGNELNDYSEDLFFKVYNQLIDLILAEINRVGLEHIEDVKVQVKNVFETAKFEETGSFEDFWRDGIMPAFDVKPSLALNGGFFSYVKLVLKYFVLVIIAFAIFLGIVYLVNRL